MSDQPYELVIAPTARRQLTEQLPEPVAFAAYQLIIGPLLENPIEWANDYAHPWTTGTAPAEAPTA